MRSLESIKRRAVAIKRDEGIPHHRALDKAASESGFSSYIQAVRTWATKGSK